MSLPFQFQSFVYFIIWGDWANVQCTLDIVESLVSHKLSTIARFSSIQIGFINQKYKLVIHDLILMQEFPLFRLLLYREYICTIYEGGRTYKQVTVPDSFIVVK